LIARLNRYLSMCGVSSRRKADELIASKKIRVNGVLVKELGLKIDTEKDVVKEGRRVLRIENKRYILLNKPRFYLTTLKESKDNKETIDDLIDDIPERVYPVGRLDYDTEGLLVLTNDGELANRILHPSYELTKVYHAIVNGIVSKGALRQMKNGTELNDGDAKPDCVRILKYFANKTDMEIAFHEGRNRLVKRFFF